MRRRIVVSIGLVLLGVLALGWMCARWPGIPYLPEEGPAHWILYPAAFSFNAQSIGPRSTVFSRSFDLESVPEHAALRVRAFGSFTVQVNGTTLVESAADAQHSWKQATETEAGRCLVPGRNRLQVMVQNEQGPPVLWLVLDAGTKQIVSDSEWQCSLLGAVSQPARLAADPPELRKGNLNVDSESMQEALARSWPTLLLVLGLAAAAAFVVHLGLRRGWFTSGQRLSWPILVLAACAIPWLVLMVNNWQSLHFAFGFDADAHIEYIQYVQKQAALPLANQGWEMHQPPLYYVLSAVVLKVCGLAPGEQGGLLVLRGLSLLMALAMSLLLAGCLRLLLPQHPLPQAVGLVIAVCLPVHLYLMHYVGNDLLAATLATAGIYLGLTLLQTEHPSTGRLVGLGLCLGAAVMTKLTALAVVLVVLAALAGQLASRRGSLLAWLRVVGIPLLVVAVVSGWFFLRNIHHFGTPLIGSYDPRSGYRWWQEPGYGTTTQSLRFGRSLTHPFYSVLDSIPDGLYSTLWGDGDLGSAVKLESRPPWNYDLMTAGYLLALVPTALALIGILAALVELARRPRADLFLLVALPAGMALAVLYHYLRYPYYCHIKAFYALPALVSLCVCAGWGFEMLTRGCRKRQIVLGTVVLAWALVSYTAFWVNSSATSTRLWVARQYLAAKDLPPAMQNLEAAFTQDRDNPQLHRLLGELLLAQGQRSQALVELRKAPEDAATHCFLALAYKQLRQFDAAGQQLERAIASSPDSFAAYPLLARLRLNQADAQRTILTARNGLRVEPTDAELHAMLATALAAEGQLDEAVRHYQIALTWQPSSLAALTGLARLRAMCEDSRYRDGQQAVQLAQRACTLTREKDSIALEALAAAYAETGRFHDAEQAIQSALALVSQPEQESLRKHLQLYQKSQPLRSKLSLIPYLPQESRPQR